MLEDKKNSRLVLGTVQLGLKYGVANKTGRPDEKVAAEIIKTAWENGICEFDTAQGYGESERVLGEVFFQLGISDRVKIISKFDPRLDHCNGEVLRDALDASLARLKVPALDGVLLHDEKLLDLWDAGLGSHLEDLVASQKVRKVGVSVYSLQSALNALEIPGIDVIQLPANVFDQRFERAGFFAKASRKGKEIYIRSVFLQGLLLMNVDNLPQHMPGVKKYLQRYQQLCRCYDLTESQLALGYISFQMPDTKMLVGVETVGQLKENISLFQKACPAEAYIKIQEIFFDLPDSVINPTLWGK